MPKSRSPALAGLAVAEPGHTGRAASRLPDASDPRQRLLAAATQVFARQGYERATTREICQLAGANVAAIHYHFGDKAGLYRAAIRVPIGEFAATREGFEAPGLSLHDALAAFFRAQLEPLLAGDDFDPFRALIAREMADPSGVLGDLLAETIEPHQQALERLLRRHTGAARVDADIELLAMALVGIGAHMTMARRVVDAMRPKLLNPVGHVERAIARLAEWGVVLVEAERARRALGRPLASTAPSTPARKRAPAASNTRGPR